MLIEIPDKLYFKIGEVAALLNIKTHVLRYWETEFNQLQPVKSRSNQRLYRRKDVEIALSIRELLYRRGFTISGARKQLARELAGELVADERTPAELFEEVKSDLLRIRRRLEKPLSD
jgi:DNA-binding transcriptional MerR regulator